MGRKIGAVTIGQAPRVDVTPEIQALLGAETAIIESGALDGLDASDIARLAPQPGDEVLVTRLLDGTAVKLAERHVIPRLQAQIDRLSAQGVDAIALLCTGRFPALHSSRLLIKPQVLLYHFVAGIAEGRKLGIVVPAAEQVEPARRRWYGLGSALQVEAGSPYGDLTELWQAAANLKRWGAELAVLDCMGFSQAMKREARAILGAPVILPRTVLARALAELLAS
ncbi:MAG: AroM family protein [Firmicutes bacterium]|nr:AroM family protein [Bacillota bacterium]